MVTKEETNQPELAVSLYQIAANDYNAWLVKLIMEALDEFAPTVCDRCQCEQHWWEFYTDKDIERWLTNRSNQASLPESPKRGKRG